MAVVLDENAIGEAVAILVEQIRATAQRSRVAIVGIRSRGDEVAERICAALEEVQQMSEATFTSAVVFT